MLLLVPYIGLNCFHYTSVEKKIVLCRLDSHYLFTDLLYGTLPTNNDLLANSSFFYVIAIGMDSKYAYVRNNYNRSFDQSSRLLLGKHFSVTLHPDDIAIQSIPANKKVNSWE
jgi:hypothetical protein